VDFETSHLIFPSLIAIVLVILGLAILITNRREIAGAGAYWREVLEGMDKIRSRDRRAAGGLLLAHGPGGRHLAQHGNGLPDLLDPLRLPYRRVVLASGWPRDLAPVAVTALVAPTLVWWLFTDLFFLTLP
jgi:hypothetical protein